MGNIHSIEIEIEIEIEKTKKRGGWSEQKGVSDTGPMESRTDIGHTEEQKNKRRKSKI